jgi:L-histidine N-alpha-methyltransferase
MIKEIEMQNMHVADHQKNRLNFMTLEQFDNHEDFKNHVLDGFRSDPKSLASHCFYNHEGSSIFDKICALPEYYLTRSEIDILENRTEEIVAEIPEEGIIAELGNGSPLKIKKILDRLFERQEDVHYAPIDISCDYMKKSVLDLVETYPNLSVTAIGGKYERGIQFLEKTETPKTILWLGSSIGNMPDDEAVKFLSRISKMMRPNDCFIIGMDLEKDWDMIKEAYDDQQGVTAEFNMNILKRINEELKADFDIDSFRHDPVCNIKESRMESYLTSVKDQNVFLRSLDLKIPFKKNESVHVEVSCKYSEDKIKKMAKQSGLHLDRQWFDSNKWFSLNLFRTER